MTYVPGYGAATTAMLAARSAAERAAFVPDSALAGATVLDVGCGPGSLTAGLAHRVGPSGRVVGVDRVAVTGYRPLVRGSAAELPIADGSVDVVFAHALLEHLPDPVLVLAEMRRVLRAGGTLAVVSSDWSGARITPGSAAAGRAVDAYRAVRRRAGADPDAGSRLASWVSLAGFAVVSVGSSFRVDLAGADLVAYVGERVGSHVVADWAAEEPPATVEQHWVSVLARRG